MAASVLYCCTYFYYEKVHRTMRTAIVSYILKSPCPDLLLYTFPLHFLLKTYVVTSFQIKIPSLITKLLLELQNICSNSVVSVKGFKVTFSICTCISFTRFLKCIVTLLPLYLHCIILLCLFRDSNIIQYHTFSHFQYFSNLTYDCNI